MCQFATLNCNRARNIELSIVSPCPIDLRSPLLFSKQFFNFTNPWIFNAKVIGQKVNSIISEITLFQTETALFQDALTLFTEAVNDLSYESGVQSMPVSCTGEGKVPDGGRINLRMKTVS